MKKSDLMPPIGAETIECIHYLVNAHTKIAEIAVGTINRPKLMQDRLLFSAAESSFFDKAMEVRTETGLPFWDALLLNSFCNQNVPDNFLKEALFHQSSLGGEKWLNRSEIGHGELPKLQSRHGGEKMLCLFSELKMTNGSKKHLVLIDFHLPVSSRNSSVVNKVASLLMPFPSFIIESGASYHVIGTKPLSSKEFRKTLIRSLLFSPIIDRAYITHQLLEGRAALRISKGGHFNQIPRLISIAGIIN